LWEEIQAQRAEMEALLAGVEKIVRDMDGANVLLGEVVEELAEETRSAERDLMAVQTARTQ
jgi:kinetochore protein NNF1